MKRFIKKWYFRYVTHKVTMKYLSNPESEPYDVMRGMENINYYVKNIVTKNGT